jgi:phenylacetate-CoA oxygenase PaaH subunit
MPTYEVFLRKEGRESFTHAGALDAADDELALLYVRETYVRRGEGAHAWVVRRDHIAEVDPEDLGVAARRAHSLNDGTVVAARRKERRADQQQTHSGNRNE